MEWNEWNGKKVFVQLKSGGNYTGEVLEVSDTGNNLIFITILDKFNKKIIFVTAEIIKIVEEE